MQEQKVLSFEQYVESCKNDPLRVRKVFVKSTRFENTYNFVLKESLDAFTQSGHWQVVAPPTDVPESVKEIQRQAKK